MFSGNNMLYVGVLVAILVVLLVVLLLLNRRSAARRPAAEDASVADDATPSSDAVAPADDSADWMRPAPASPDADWMTAAADEPLWTDAQTETQTPVAAEAPVIAEIPEAAEIAVAAQTPTAAPAQTSALAAVPAAPASPRAATGRADPVRTAVLSLLDSPGELLPTETRRLELYRPERVLSIVEELEPAYAGKGKEQQRTRLGRIRKYAQEFQEDLPEPVAATALGAATLAGLTLVVDQPSPEASATPAADEWPPDIEATDSDTTAESEAAAHALYAVPAYAGEGSDSRVAVEPVGVDEPMVVDETPDETFEAAQPQTWTSWQAPEEHAVAETAQIATTAAVVEELANDGPSHAPPTPEAEASATNDALRSLQVDVSTAEDVLELPQSERVDALAFLGPEELGRTFSLAGEDSNLKRAAIDILEQQGTPEALAAIQQCFDDEDPELQTYAVDSAERLLAQIGGGA